MIPSWLIIAGVTFLIALGANLITPDDRRWFRRLRRPDWLTFEAAIPIIWSVIFICGAWSAYLVWERDPGSSTTGWRMAAYILLEIAVVAYTPVMFRLRSLRAGTLIGATGFVIGTVLVINILPISSGAALLLIPYLLWSPIGTYTTWDMIRLNPADA